MSEIQLIIHIIMSEKEILDGYLLIMSDNLNINKPDWNKVGEYYQQFSIYTREFKTCVTNKI